MKAAVFWVVALFTYVWKAPAASIIGAMETAIFNTDSFTAVKTTTLFFRQY
jgi:hypothetical protein